MSQNCMFGCGRHGRHLQLDIRGVGGGGVVSGMMEIGGNKDIFERGS